MGGRVGQKVSVTSHLLWDLPAPNTFDESSEFLQVQINQGKLPKSLQKPKSRPELILI